MLLGPDDPAPYRLLRADGASPFLLTADHAGRAIPSALGDLGVSATERARHIGWDIGIADVTERLSALLDASALLQTYSRLVIDCNRRPELPNAFPEVSEATPIPGNFGLTGVDKEARCKAVFAPYHAAIAAAIAARRGRSQPTLYVAMHSFTPVYHGVARPMHVAVLYHRRPRLAQALAARLRAEAGLVVAENEPYHVSDETDYGVPVHAEAGALDYVEIEIRQDLIDAVDGQAAWAARLAHLLPLAAADIAEAGA
ncbi:MAG: N-formylglutamate amidohydrolase [Proteobacteria bacterium]|nr:N-formylglutamate amidohydrolase [Pseudomonadota bacterium]